MLKLYWLISTKNVTLLENFFGDLGAVGKLLK